MRITSTGNVGIGTTTPGHKLTLPHSSNIAWEYGTGDAFEYTTIGKGDGGVPLAFKTTWTGSPTNKIYAFYGLNPSSVETELLTILNGGNVGIGINPEAKLDVNGGIFVERESGITFSGPVVGDRVRSSIKSSSSDNTITYHAFGNHRWTQGSSNTEFMRITNIGLVGIGTSAPLNKLEVRITGADSDNGIMITRSDATTTTNEILGGIGFDSTDGNTPSSILEASAYIAAFAAEDHSADDKGGYLTFGTAPIDQDDDTVSLERMRITAAGEVGIGRIDPQDLLNIHNSSANANIGFKITRGAQTHGLRLGVNDTHAFLWTTENQNLAFATNNAQRMTITAAGNVGIGTTNPGQTLDVNGAITTQTYFNVDNTNSSREKIKLYADQSDYVIGMQNGITFGGLNDWGMTFQFNDEDDRGFWWGDAAHTTAQGAMALTTNGLLTVASGIRVGYGQSDTTTPTSGLLDVSGSISIDGLSLQDTATVTTTSTTQTALASYAVATYATGKFLIQATSAGNRHISELLVTHNGTVSTATEYAILKTAGNLFTVTTDISGGNVRILVTSASTTSTVYRTSFTLIGV
jgi:hypothetical protein